MAGYLADYHVHTRFSFDSEETIGAIRKMAAARGLDAVCITDHFSVNPKDKSFGLYPYREARAEYLSGSAGPGPAVSFGLEIGEGQYRRDTLARFLDQADYDFIIGSVHNIGDITIRQTIRQHGADYAFDAYYDEVLGLAEQGDYDVIGHLDLVNRYAWDEQGIYRLDAYADKIDAVLRAVVRRGIEVNTSSLRKNCRQFLPNPWIVRRFRELGGEIITLGSDAHSATRVGDGLPEAAALLKDCGFEATAAFEKRRPRLMPIGD
ncbi:histidinol-phosphatase HisJ family protein [Eubacterium sp. 1001713B170207_170306_E7]|uniref:histidinol-phosphatase HisJ family protein n=1 Tax=Eubacterium sp. 1001713B170207_170306_E7 TaxID=2787097 RepID=UPI001897C456|nr:histidinol-phosphatase HisJ family protein [Eubacterium sp. 1001713B170207_170306_E7]